MCSPPKQEAQFWKETQSIFNEKHHFLDVKTTLNPPEMNYPLGPRPSKSIEHKHFFNIFGFQPHQATSYTHFTRHIFHFPVMFLNEFHENMFPA